MNDGTSSQRMSGFFPATDGGQSQHQGQGHVSSASLLTLWAMGAAVCLSGCQHMGGGSTASSCDAACVVPNNYSYSAPAVTPYSQIHAPSEVHQQLPPAEPLMPPQEPPQEPAPKAPATDSFLPPAQAPEKAKPAPAPVPAPTTGNFSDSGFRPASTGYFPPESR